MPFREVRVPSWNAPGRRNCDIYALVWAIDPRHGCPIESKRGPFFSSTALPPRSTAGHLPLEQVIGVRIPGGQPNLRRLPFPFRVSWVRFVYAGSGIAPKPYLEVNHGPTHVRESRGLSGRIGA